MLFLLLPLMLCVINWKIINKCSIKVIKSNVIHRIPNGGRLGKASVREHENEAGEDRIENVQKSIR